MEPFSPFAPDTPTSFEEDLYRPTLLSPPPIVSPKLVRQLSPLRPTDAPNPAKGLERERFDALLKSCRERNASVGAKKSPDLRKEIALKAHKTKQMERRALFLSKVQAPPSPSATITPKTPPESPAVFHYSLPSPGLESPLEVFESLALDHPSVPVCKPWVEQVDFRLPSQQLPRAASKPDPVIHNRKPLPSLDQITARMSSHGVVPPQETVSHPRTTVRLPAFLQSGRRTPPQETRPTIVVDPSPEEVPDMPPVTYAKLTAPQFYLPLVSPKSPDLRITTTVVPHSSSASPIKLTEANINAFNRNAREDTARRMLLRLRRRNLPPLTAACSACNFSADTEEEERKFRRRSAPPELPQMERSGFTHPILQLPGAF